MIFIIDLTIKAEEKVLRLWSFSSQKSPKPRFRGAKIQNFSGGESPDPLYASTFQLSPGINSDSDPPLTSIQAVMAY